MNKTLEKLAIFSLFTAAGIAWSGCEEGFDSDRMEDDTTVEADVDSEAATQAQDSEDGIADESEATKEADENEEATIAGVLLHELEISEGHKLMFYTMEDGGTLVRESSLIDNGEAHITDSVGEGTTMAEIFEMAAPGVPIPDALVDADFSDTLAESDELEMDPPPALDPLEAGAELEFDGTMSQGTCSPDYYNDGWGKQWFIDNYCTEGNFRYCDGNWTARQIQTSSTKWMKFHGAAADFWYGARMQGYYWYSKRTFNLICMCYVGGSFWVSLWDVPISPRHVETFHYTNSSYNYYRVEITGDEPCPRIHYAMMYK